MPAQRYRSWDDYDADAGEPLELEPAAQEDEDDPASAAAELLEDWSDDGWLDDWAMSSSVLPNEDYE